MKIYILTDQYLISQFYELIAWLLILFGVLNVFSVESFVFNFYLTFHLSPHIMQLNYKKQKLNSHGSPISWVLKLQRILLVFRWPKLITPSMKSVCVFEIFYFDSLFFLLSLFIWTNIECCFHYWFVVATVACRFHKILLRKQRILYCGCVRSAHETIATSNYKFTVNYQAILIHQIMRCQTICLMHNILFSVCLFSFLELFSSTCDELRLSVEFTESSRF